MPVSQNRPRSEPHCEDCSERLTAGKLIDYTPWVLAASNIRSTNKRCFFLNFARIARFAGGFLGHARLILTTPTVTSAADRTSVAIAKIFVPENDTQELVIEPGGVSVYDWRELWRYRELFQVLARRDLAVRYKQTALGVAWAILRPLLTMGVFTVIFGGIANLPSDGKAPYALLVITGMLPWTFISTALNDASSSVLGNAGLVSKVYFPRLVIPGSAIAVALVDLLIAFIIAVGMLAWCQWWPGWQVILLPLFIFLAAWVVLGPSLWVAAMNVKYRDFRHVTPFMIQLGLYISPVGFSSSLIPDRWRLLYELNPAVGVIDCFRWCLLGVGPFPWSSVICSLSMSLLTSWIGYRQFRRLERSFADII